jgi:outer membrane receptor protein involved in Fe transport
MAKPSVRAVVQGLLATAAYITAHAAFAAAPVADEVHSWNIPAEDGPSAVRDFGIQSGVAISAVQTDLQGLKLNAVNGSMSVDKALKTLVAGTGLKYVYDASGRAVTLTSATKAAAPAAAPTVPASNKADPPPTAEDALLLEEIVVTARKREENLQEVPISAEVISGKTLGEYNIRALTELSQSLPGIQLNGTGAGGQFFIRGIGSGVSQTFDQSVGTFIDDIYHGRTRVAEEAFLDLDRVEVLKGPQSTFFGNNAVAGALNIVTAKPNTDNFDGSIRALYGQYGQYAGEGMLNIPLNSDFAVRIAAVGDGMKGWAKDPYAGHDKPDQNNKAGRVTFLYKPGDDFDATLKIEGGANRQEDGSVIGSCPVPAPFLTAAGAPANAGFCKSALAAGYPVGINNFRDTTNAGQAIDLSTFEDVLTMHYRLGDHTLTSVTGFYNYHFQETLDADGTPAQGLTLDTREAYHQVSQELRIASPQGQTLEYLAGLYFQNDHLDAVPGDIDYYYLTTLAPKFAALRPYLPLAQTSPYQQAEHSYAAFGSLDWNVTDQLRVGAGIRESWVYKTAASEPVYGTATAPYGGVVPLPTAALQTVANSMLGAYTSWSLAESYHAPMPSAQIEYKIVPAVMLYATYSRGFLAGVPNTGLRANIQQYPVQAEHVNDYEAGIKSAFFQDHLRLNLDVFRSNYTNLEVSSSVINAAGVTGSALTNAASSRTQGVELSGELAASGFRFRTAVTYLNARYLSYPNVTNTQEQSYCRANYATVAACRAAFPGGAPSQFQDLSGKPTEFAPTWSGSETVSYNFLLPGGFHFITEADVYASTTYFYGNTGTDDPGQMQPGYARLDGRLSFESPDEHWAVDLVMKNLTDKIIILGGAGGTNLPTSQGSTLLQIDQPRNVAIQARYQW